MPLPTKAPVPSLGGAMLRHRPILPVGVFGPMGLRFVDGCIDCGSDDTIFPLSLAHKLRINWLELPLRWALLRHGVLVSSILNAVQSVKYS